ncbi:MAG: CDGSH iron-sulfur domain-containing protein [Actinomycetota bacterium]
MRGTRRQRTVLRRPGSAGHRRGVTTRGGADHRGYRVTVFDDRTRCAHFGQCTDRLSSVFGLSEVAFVDPRGASSSQITEEVSGCPSGALTYATTADAITVEAHEHASIHPILDGPYRVRGGVEVLGVDKVAYESRERQALCLCGQSRNTPFCDGSHWYAGLPVDRPPGRERGRKRYAREHGTPAAPAPG